MEDIIYYSALPDGTENLYGLTSSGKIYCFNNKKGKVEVILEESDIIYFGGRERSLIYCSDMHAYVFHDDKIISIPLDKENRLKKFVNYYNIFAPHYK